MKQTMSVHQISVNLFVAKVAHDSDTDSQKLPVYHAKNLD